MTLLLVLLFAAWSACLGWGYARGEVPRLAVAGPVYAVQWSWYWLVHTEPELVRPWVTMLQEGTTAAVVMALYGGYGHAGPELNAFAAFVLGMEPEAVGIVELAWFNVWMWGLAVSIASGLAIATQRDVFAFAIIGSFFATAHAANLALSETAAAPATLLFLAAACTWPLVRGGGPMPLRALAGACTVGLMAVAALLRIELAVFAGVALLAVAGHLSGHDLPALRRRLYATLSARLDAASRYGLVGLFVAVYAICWVVLPALGLRAYGAAALNPLGPGGWTLPTSLAMVWPLGLVVLATLGLAEGLARPERTGGLAFAVLIVHAAHTAAAHTGTAVWEVYRYLGYLIGPAYVLALSGWPALCELAEARGWPSQWRRPVLLLLVVLWPASAPSPAPSHFAAAQAVGNGSWHPLEGVLLAADQNVEARWLLQTQASWERCDVYAPVILDGAVRRGYTAETPLDGFLHFGAVSPPARYLVGDPPDDPYVQHAGGPHDFADWTLETLADLVRRTATTDCALLYTGLDCGLAPGRRCVELLPDAVPTLFTPAPPDVYYFHAERPEPVSLAMYPL